MHEIIKPFVNLSQANTESITRFVQSPEVTELATTGAEKYLALAQKSFGHALASGAQVELIRRLTENYTTFAKEYSESLVGIATEAQAQMTQQARAASDKFAESTQASAAAISEASKAMKPPKTT